jgi:hypothetical protein
MTDIPGDPKKIRARIRRYERRLEEERREFGCCHDGAGKRYFIGRAERLPEAVAKLRETMLQNRFLLPRLLGKNVHALHISPDSDELEMMHIDHIPEEYIEIWKERELLWASTLYEGEFSTVRAHCIAIERELEHEPRGERRTQLVNELFGMKR